MSVRSVGLLAVPTFFFPLNKILKRTNPEACPRCLRQRHNIRFYENLPQYTIDKVPLKIYTNGSVMKSGIACAYTVSQNNIFIHDHAIRLNNENRIYQAELFAIDKAVEWLATTKNRSVLILTDSRSSLDALRLAFLRNIILKNIFKKLFSLQNCNIDITWLKSHTGFIGNEKADALARNAVSENQYEVFSSLPIPVTEVKLFFKKKITANLLGSFK